MIRGFARLLAGIGFVATVSTAQADAPQSCTLTLFTKLDMRTSPAGLISIPVSIQGREFNFELETTGGFGGINSQTVDAVQLKVRKKEPARWGEPRYFVSVPEFSIGPIKGQMVDFDVLERRLDDADGQVTSNLLGRFDLELDFAAGKVSLYSQNHCPGKVVSWTTDASAVAIIPIDLNYMTIKVPVAVDGKTVPAIVETGASTSVMNVAVAKRYLDFDEHAPGVQPQTIILNGRSEKAYIYPFKALNFGDVTVFNPHIVIVNDPIVGNEFVLGIGILRQLHIYVAYGEKKLYVTSATAH